MIDRCNDQGFCILPIIEDSWTEEGENPPREQTPGEGVDVRWSLYIEERYRSFLQICENSHSLRLFLKRKKDRGGVQGSVLGAVPQTYRPEAVLWRGGYHALPVDRLFDDAQVPEGLFPNCNLRENKNS